MLFSVLCFLFLPWWFDGWNGKDPVNVIISMEESIAVLSVRPEENRLVIVLIPSNTVLDIPRRGQWSARALWGLFLLEQDSRIIESPGWDLLQVPIDGYIHIDRFTDIQNWTYLSVDVGHIPTEVYRFWSCTFGQAVGCRGHPWETPSRLRLVQYIRSLRPQHIERLSLETVASARRVIDAGGNEELHIDPGLASLLVAEWFSIRSWSSSGLTVAVRTTTNEERVGIQRAEMLEHMGIRIISMTAADDQSKVVVRHPHQKSNPIVIRIARWFNIPIEVLQFEERADVLVIL